MKKSMLILLINTIIIIHGNSQYYDFPFIGWKQTFTSYTWTGTQNQTGITSLSFDRDTIIDGQSYISNGYTHFRSHEGKIFQLNYDWQTQSFYESLEYDYTLNIGDILINETFALEDSARVINKERIINLVGDSIWQIDIQFQLNWIVKDTITWIEGVGNLYSGLIKTNFPDGGYSHSCTLLANNRKTFVNYNNTDYCNCRFEYGIDRDNDGYGNYTSRIAEVDLGFHFNNPSAEKTYKVRSCDTLKVISTDLDNIYFSSMESCNGNFISIDSFSNTDINGEVLYTYFINNIEAYDKIYLSDQCSWDFAEIYIYPCFQNDCDDNNPNVNLNQIEEPYNGIDDDCDSATLDDDLDQDGFRLADDCDDNNPNINPDQTEEPYNGVDDDCNSATLDDDLDQDGFLIADDCDDNNANINPDQTEEPYNGIDDDCNSATLDDDLDQDGFVLTDDCDDSNPNINPNQTEEPYNGIDDDCDSATLDDDLDQDGFVLAEDCDDNNPNINPDAEEIPDNGIDEDCDGEDMTTGIHELAYSKIRIYPNPVADVLNIDVDGQLDFKVSIFDLSGKLVILSNNKRTIDVSFITQGSYLLELEDQKTGQKIVDKIIIGN